MAQGAISSVGKSRKKRGVAWVNGGCSPMAEWDGWAAGPAVVKAGGAGSQTHLEEAHAPAPALYRAPQFPLYLPNAALSTCWSSDSKQPLKEGSVPAETLNFPAEQEAA